MAHVDALTKIGPRPQDSDGSRTAAGYIEDELDRLGVHATRMPVGDVEKPEIRVPGLFFRPREIVHTTDPDLVVRFGPPGKALLFTAHYDTVPLSPGAADDAASVGLLLDLARVLREHAPPQPVMLAFTANEEIGLVGAEALARDHGNEIEFAIALDLVGGDGPLVINGASTLIGDAELGWLADAANRAGIRITAPPVHRAISRAWPQIERADHGAFTRRGIPAVHFYNRGNDGEWIDLAYHSPRDVPARLSRASLDEAGRLLRALALVPPPPHAGDGYWLPLARNVVVPRWAPLLAELALLAIAIGALVLSRDGLVAVIVRARQRGGREVVKSPRAPGAAFGIACYVVALAIACVIERATYVGHPAPWLHAPLRALVADVLVLLGLFGLATRLVGRVRPWTGAQRYLAIAVVQCVLVGGALLALGAAELAWVWLVPAAVIAIAPRLGRAGVVAIAVAALPVVLALHPAQLREAAWNGFLPVSLPLTLLVGTVGAPTVATLAWWLRRGRPRGPLGTLVLGMGCGLAVLVGVVFAVTYSPPCTAVEFQRFHLACERV
jgi:hypothetical protein